MILGIREYLLDKTLVWQVYTSEHPGPSTVQRDSF